MMPTLQLRRTSLFWFQGAWELGRVELLATSCFVFVCLFVFQLPRWVIILFLSLTSGWGFLFFFFVCLFCFVLFCFVFLCFVLFFLQNVQFPHHISRVRLIFFFFLSRRLVKFFAFFYFCYLLCFQKFHPSWYQMVRPYPYSVTQMRVDITSSTILNSRAIQWKI